VYDKPALHHAGFIVEARLGAQVHVTDPLVSAFAEQSEVGLAVAVRISSGPGFQKKTFPVLVFDVHRFAGLAQRRGGWGQGGYHGASQRDEASVAPAGAIAQRTGATATDSDHGNHAHERAYDGADVRDRAPGHGHEHADDRGDAAARAAADRVGLR